MTILATLCYIKKDNQLLLQRKTKELFGGDKYNAPGGKLMEQEDPEQGVIREVEEETGLKVFNLINQGILHFYDGDESSPAWSVHLFSTEQFQGELKTKVREGTHEWINFNDIPYSKMWEDDKYFLSTVLEGKHVVGHFYFEKGFGPIYKHTLEVKKIN
ncbi:NUDIX hydrolase [Candidatus Woesearchaeota archaeon CG_4_10_14_0_2_um_filter_33_13]|nr:MAG: NUDIX hydrolase [Candidatus Woesearchaeota archaeon CG_4_10_14_0_2_um_filter_33_13]